MSHPSPGSGFRAPHLEEPGPSSDSYGSLEINGITHTKQLDWLAWLNYVTSNNDASGQGQLISNIKMAFLNDINIRLNEFYLI